MTTAQHHPDRTNRRAGAGQRRQPSPQALTLAAYLIERPRPGTGEDDACLRTHIQVRIAGSDIVHRLDVRAKTLYTTGCGERITKTAGVLTAAAVDCMHQGCRVGGAQ